MVAIRTVAQNPFFSTFLPVRFGRAAFLPIMVTSAVRATARAGASEAGAVNAFAAARHSARTSRRSDIGKGQEEKCATGHGEQCSEMPCECK